MATNRHKNGNKTGDVNKTEMETRLKMAIKLPKMAIKLSFGSFVAILDSFIAI